MTALKQLKEVMALPVTVEEKHHKVFYEGLATQVMEEVGYEYYPEEGSNLSEIIDFYNVMILKSREKDKENH